MSKVTVSDEIMMGALRDVVAAQPDYVYSAPAHMVPTDGSADIGCYYVHTDAETGKKSPGCLIACALVRVGVPLESLVLWEGDSAYAVVNGLIDGLSNITRNVMERAQDAQDNGATWLDSFNHALNRPKGVEL